MRNIHKIGKELFITSDEEIKEGYWCFEVHNGDSKSNSPKFIDENWNTWWLRKTNANDIAGCSTTKKIILTTDIDLIKDGVQAIDNEFLEWFAKNPNCEEVEVEIKYNCKEIGNCIFDSYKTIIPKEETLEEAAKRYSLNTINAFGDYQSFIAGYKLAQERSYSEEEVLELLKKIYRDNEFNGTIDEWFKQFKKNK